MAGTRKQHPVRRKTPNTLASEAIKLANKAIDLANPINPQIGGAIISSPLGVQNMNPSAPYAPEQPEMNGIPLMEERGTSGLRTFTGFVTEAYNAQLTWPTVEPLYRRLIRSVPEVALVRQAFTTWARGVDLVCDLPDDASDDDKRFQEFFYQVVQQDLEGGVDQLKHTIVSNVPFYGWGWFSVVPGIRRQDWDPPTIDPLAPDGWRSRFDDGLIGIRRIAWRAPSSFYRWIFDTRKHLTGMIQRDWPAYTPVALPLNESMHMTYGDPNNPEGLSPLEAVWRLERMRFGLEVVQGIGFEHSAGYLDIKKTVPGAISSTDQMNVKSAALAILSAQEGNFAFWPTGIEGAVKDIPFQAAGALLDAIKHYSVLMLTVFMMSFLGMNTMTGTGSRAATSDISQLGVVSFNSMMAGFAAQFYNQVFRRLWLWNKSSFPQSQGLHTLRFTEVSKDYALTDLAQFITAYGNLFVMSDDDSKAIRKRSGFLPDTLPEADQPEPPKGEPAVGMGTNKQLAQLLLREDSRRSRG